MRGPKPVLAGDGISCTVGVYRSVNRDTVGVVPPERVGDGTCRGGVGKEERPEMSLALEIMLSAIPEALVMIEFTWVWICRGRLDVFEFPDSGLSPDIAVNLKSLSGRTSRSCSGSMTIVRGIEMSVREGNKESKEQTDNIKS